ncbi:hypothetical protein DPMN_188691 [Dreissena polymorpha]|uniref:Uncharacterized protein n=4 Tax=Dreissena polymorpha TaxID=45954 RepID=A0A9D4DRR4_DREPO|nr:hypothetical protein DPMN_188691 [Dreissena polymorpha]
MSFELSQSISKAATSFKNKVGMTQQYTNKAYESFPEEEEYKISGSDDNDDVSSEESDSAVSTNDSAYQTISKTSRDSASAGTSDVKQRRKTTKKIR